MQLGALLWPNRVKCSRQCKWGQVPRGRGPARNPHIVCSAKRKAVRIPVPISLTVPQLLLVCLSAGSLALGSWRLPREMAAAPAAPAAEVVLRVPDASIMAVCDGTVEKIAGGVLNVVTAVSSTGQRYSKLVLDTFSYRLAPHQPVLRSADRTFILPSDPSLHYVVTFGKGAAAEAIAAFERLLQEATTLRNRGDAVGASASAAATAPAAAAAAAGSVSVRGSGAAVTGPAAAPALSPSAVAALPIATVVTGAAGAPTSSPAAAGAPAADAGDAAAAAAGGPGYAATIGSYLATGIGYTGKLVAAGVVVGADYAGYGVKW